MINNIFILLFFCLPFTLKAAEDILNDAIVTEDQTKTEKPRLSKHRTSWNGWEWDDLTFNIGAGFLTDSANYKQDEESKEQMNLKPSTKIRDLRFIGKGKFKKIDNLSYTIGYMFDGVDENWRFRQTGLIYTVKDWNGDIFIGRTKEQFSINKITVGYYGWVQERSAANDAFLPILGDGIRWMGTGFNNYLNYGIGFYKNNIFPYESYAKDEEVFSFRTIFLPFAQSEDKGVLHLCLAGRFGNSKNGSLQYRSKPESNAAQEYAVDTGKFRAQNSKMANLEFYYIPGPFMIGSEYYFNQVNSNEENDPFFHGGDVFVSYFFTGETRSYNKKRSVFENLVPKSSFFTGGTGAVEAVLRYSYADLTDEKIDGGIFQRITPMVNWYLSDSVRLELIYGYSALDRDGINGKTQYLQTRIQFSVL